MEPMHTVWQHKATALPFLWCLRLVVVHNKKTALDYHTNPGRLECRKKRHRKKRHRKKWHRKKGTRKKWHRKKRHKVHDRKKWHNFFSIISIIQAIFFC